MQALATQVVAKAARPQIGHYTLRETIGEGGCGVVYVAEQEEPIRRRVALKFITLHDGVPVPKVIDFGIAKATEGRLTNLTVYTELRQFIGTPGQGRFGPLHGLCPPARA